MNDAFFFNANVKLSGLEPDADRELRNYIYGGRNSRCTCKTRCHQRNSFGRMRRVCARAPTRRKKYSARAPSNFNISLLTLDTDGDVPFLLLGRNITRVRRLARGERARVSRDRMQLILYDNGTRSWNINHGLRARKVYDATNSTNRVFFFFFLSLRVQHIWKYFHKRIEDNRFLQLFWGWKLRCL